MIILNPLWKYEVDSKIQALAFSDDGLLGLTSWDFCAYIFDQNGNLVSKYCGVGDMGDASFCCNKFGFMNLGGYAYIYDLSTRTWKRVYAGDDYVEAITMLKNGFLAGWNKLAYFDFSGYKRWDVHIPNIVNGPAVYKDYVYVARHECCWNSANVLVILKLSDGIIIRAIRFEEAVLDVQVCGNYLALGTAHHVYFYDISDPTNPKELWNYNGIATSCSGRGCEGAWNVAFSPDCKYLASTDYSDRKIHIFNVKTGKQVLEKKFKDYVTAVAWWRNRIAVGLLNGKVYVYKTFALATELDALLDEQTAKQSILDHNNKDAIQLELD